MPEISHKKLGELYDVMFNRLKNVQVKHNFDKLIKDRSEATYKGKPNKWFFKHMVMCTFGSRQRGDTVERKRRAIKKAFSNFDVSKVPEYSEGNFNRLAVDNPDIKMAGWKGKVKASMNNARVMWDIIKEYDGRFEKYATKVLATKVLRMKRHDVADISALKKEFENKKFSYIKGTALMLDFLNNAGIIDCLKPSREVRRMLSRLGFIREITDSLKKQVTIETAQTIQDIGRNMSKDRLSAVDAVLWQYGTGQKKYIDRKKWKAPCLKGTPLCLEDPSACDLTRYCRHYKKHKQRKKKLDKFWSGREELNFH